MTRWTQAQFLAHRQKLIEAKAVADEKTKPSDPYKSSWERRFAELLGYRQQSGDIKSWSYEPITLKPPGGVRYTPDFIAEASDGVPEVFEIKGQMRDNARIKLRQAVQLFPWFRWHIVRGDMVPIRMRRPEDVPAASRSKRQDDD